MQIDERLPALVRLVKAWAGARGLNDASNGTFNSYALTLLVRTNQSAPLIFKPLPPLSPCRVPACSANFLRSSLWVPSWPAATHGTYPMCAPPASA